MFFRTDKATGCVHHYPPALEYHPQSAKSMLHSEPLCPCALQSPLSRQNPPLHMPGNVSAGSFTDIVVGPYRKIRQVKEFEHSAVPVFIREINLVLPDDFHI